ncbi:ribonuclease H-like domain-containing protein [Tanacetum coccineum]
MACSMLTTEEMRLKSKSLSLPVDSSSSFLMVLMVETCITRRPSTPHVKSWRSCYNFARGSCRFGNECKFVHDENAKSNGNKTVNGINLDELLTKPLDIGFNYQPAQQFAVAQFGYPYASPVQPISMALSVSHSAHMPAAVLAIAHPGSIRPTVNPGQETMLPHAFTAGTLHDPYTGAWNMDTGMFLSQRKYAIEILERSHMVGCNPSWTSVDTESKLRDYSDPVSDPTLYRSLVGSLQYCQPQNIELNKESRSLFRQQHTEQPEFNNEGGVDQDSEQCYGKCPLPAKLTNHKTTELSNKSLNNEAKVKHDIDEIETINIELEHKSIENADLKAQIQEKVLENATLKKELRKLKRNSVDTKFAKPSILGKLILQPLRNQSVVRQGSCVKSERPDFKHDLLPPKLM